MSKPSFSNIDLWLFEYAEGNLTPDQEAQLELFILQHPELDVDRDMWEMAKVQHHEVSYPEEQSLYRRKPVGAVWGIGVGVATMTLMIFAGYFFLGQGGVDSVDSMFKNSYESASDAMLSHSGYTSEELYLHKEIADLKVLVASLESELQRNRGALEQASQGYAVNDPNPGNVTQPGTALNGSITERPNAGGSVNVASNNAAFASINGTSTQNTSLASLNQENNSELIAMSQMDHIGPAVLKSPIRDLQPVTSHAFGTSWDVEAQVLKHREESLKKNRVASNYESSYKHKLSQFIRRLRRMANNPIALKNYRDPYHHVPGLTSTDLNFGSTGTMIAPRFQALSRLQWRGSSNEMFTNQVAMDGYVYGLRGGIGVQMTHNYYNNGGIQTGEVAVTYSPKLSVNQKLSIEPAVRFKMGSKVLDAERMNGQSQVEMLGGNAIDYYADGTQPVGNMLWYRDLGLGLNVNTEWFYASAQVDNMFRHRDNIYSNDLTEKRRAGTYFVATLGTDWESNDSQWETERSKFSLSPYLVYRNFEDVNELWAGANFRAYWLTIGASISTNRDPAASIGIVSRDKRFSLMYNVDYMRSIMTDERSLSHQLMLRIVGKQNRKGRRI